MEIRWRIERERERERVDLKRSQSTEETTRKRLAYDTSLFRFGGTRAMFNILPAQPPVSARVARCDHAGKRSQGSPTVGTSYPDAATEGSHSADPLASLFSIVSMLLARIVHFVVCQWAVTETLSLVDRCCGNILDVNAPRPPPPQPTPFQPTEHYFGSRVQLCRWTRYSPSFSSAYWLAQYSELETVHSKCFYFTAVLVLTHNLSVSLYTTVCFYRFVYFVSFFLWLLWGGGSALSSFAADQTGQEGDIETPSSCTLSTLEKKNREKSFHVCFFISFSFLLSVCLSVVLSFSLFFIWSLLKFLFLPPPLPPILCLFACADQFGWALKNAILCWLISAPVSKLRKDTTFVSLVVLCTLFVIGVIAFLTPMNYDTQRFNSYKRKFKILSWR